MRILYLWFAAALFMIFAMARGTALAAEAGTGERSTVPYMISQIGDETLRSALTLYRPDYDTLSRQEQVGSFVNLYSAFYGAPPVLSAGDAALNAAHAAALSAPAPFVPRFEPWQDPTWHPMRDIGILGLGFDAFF